MRYSRASRRVGVRRRRQGETDEPHENEYHAAQLNEAMAGAP